MDIQVRAKSLPQAAALRLFAIKTVGEALAQFNLVIEVVSVQLSDINGPERGGVDKLCRIVVRLKNYSNLIVEDLCNSFDRAIERAAERMNQTLGRQQPFLTQIGPN